MEAAPGRRLPVGLEEASGAPSCCRRRPSAPTPGGRWGLGWAGFCSCSGWSGEVAAAPFREPQVMFEHLKLVHPN